MKQKLELSEEDIIRYVMMGIQAEGYEVVGKPSMEYIYSEPDGPHPGGTFPVLTIEVRSIAKVIASIPLPKRV